MVPSAGAHGARLPFRFPSDGQQGEIFPRCVLRSHSVFRDSVEKSLEFPCLLQALREASRSRVGPTGRFQERRESVRAPPAGTPGRSSGVPESACNISAQLCNISAQFLWHLCEDRRDRGGPATLRKRGQICGRPLGGGRAGRCSSCLGEPQKHRRDVVKRLRFPIFSIIFVGPLSRRTRPMSGSAELR